MGIYGRYVSPFDSVPKQVWEDLQYEIARHGLECSDNYRAYRFKDDHLFKEYMKAAESGCCGCFESSTTVDGDKWIIGCHYGH